jgi:hypothetical protein
MKKEQTPKGKTIARSNARELTAEEIAIVSGGQRQECVCTCANSSTPCGVDDTSAR